MFAHGLFHLAYALLEEASALLTRTHHTNQQHILSRTRPKTSAHHQRRWPTGHTGRTGRTGRTGQSFKLHNIVNWVFVCRLKGHSFLLYGVLSACNFSISFSFFIF